MSTDTQIIPIDLKSRFVVVMVSIFLGALSVLVDIYLDYLVLGHSSFSEYLNFEYSTGQFITRRYWVLLYPVLGLIIHYLIVSRKIGIYKEEVKLMDFLENSEELIVIYNPKKIILVNQSFRRKLGYSNNDVSDMQIDDFFKTYKEFENIVNGEFSWICKDGTTLDVEVVITSVSYREEKIIIANDITEKKQLIKDRNQLQRQIDIEKQMNLVGQLAGGIAHDFNNLLSIIMGNAELLKYEQFEDNKIDEMIERIISSSNKASDLIEQLLTISKNKTFELEIVNLHNILEDVVKMTDRVFPKKIQIKFHDIDTQLIIKCDESQLFNAILNIFLNAKDAMTNGGILTIKTATKEFSGDDLSKLGYQLKPGKYVEIIIQDNGIGMDDYVMNQIFNPFFTTKKQGTGLGLSRVYSIIRSHHGWITVNSKKAKGTRFNLYLPLIDSEQRNARMSDQEVLLFQNYNCLIVDDEIWIREILSEYLTNEGCTIAMSGDPIDALTYYNQNYEKLDLVFLDVDMAGINGWEVIERMKSVDPEVDNIILITGSIDLSDNNLREYKSQIRGVLKKPFNRKDLLKTIEIGS